ncbi:hypothetical protein [Halalkalicoccus ordinarius]
MTTCQRCDGEFEPEELIRHERPRLVLVHCPDCGTFLGEYHDHGRG